MVEERDWKTERENFKRLYLKQLDINEKLYMEVHSLENKIEKYETVKKLLNIITKEE